MMAEQSYLHLARAHELKDKKQRFLYRFFEMLPGGLAWLTLIGLVVASRFIPGPTSIVLIIFVIFWFFRTIYFSFHLKSGFDKTRQEQRKNWKQKLEELSFPRPTLPDITSWRAIWHLIIFPSYREPYEVLRDSCEALKNSGYPLNRIIVVLALEEREGKIARAKAERIQEAYKNTFGHLLVTFHSGREGEIAGKGANETYACKETIERIIKPAAIPYEHIIVSAFDSDTRATPGFFHCLTYHYLTCEKPLRSSFQPVPLYTNNIWCAPAIARVLSFSSTFWQMIQQIRPEILITYSSHSMGLAPLVEIGFWQKNVVSEDSRIFYQCFLHFDGDWTVMPIYFPITMDANIAKTLWQTMKNQYKQQRRWAYGVENIPYLLFGYTKNKCIPFRKKFLHAWNIVEGFHSWTTHSIILFVLGWLPIWFGPKDFSFTILSYNLPQIAGLFMRIAMLGILMTAYLATMLMPPREKKPTVWEKIGFFAQWILSPLALFLSTIPALDAATRLMLGKYMEFWVTPKQRIEKT